MERDLLLMTLVIFIPTLFALPLCFGWRWLFRSQELEKEVMRYWALGGTLLTLIVSMIIFIDYYQDTNSRGQDMREHHNPDKLLAARVDDALADQFSLRPRNNRDWIARVPWISRFNIDYYLGIDGISMALVLLTTALAFLAMLASWNIEKYVRGYLILFLLLETGMVGTFLALDFFLFYIFWEIMLLPMYFLIGVWGGPRREYAAIKFFLYTLLGSVFILIALLGFYFTDSHSFVSPQLAEKVAARLQEKNPSLSKEQVVEQTQKLIAKKFENSFDLVQLQHVGRAAADFLSKSPEEQEKLKAQNPAYNQSFFTTTFQVIMFLMLFIGFAIKVPVFPFHTWLPDAHVEAPTPISMILAGVLLKMGGYGILRIAYPICPWAAEYLAWYVALFGMINIVYGAFAAMAQTDFKKLVAYSSISHMGYVILGIAVWSATGTQYWSWGMNGAMFQMIAHGVSSAGMFFLVGVIYDRAHHRNLDNFRGLYEPMPVYGGISAIIFFAALGLPGLCGFVGEFMVVLSAWNFNPPGFPNAGPIFSILAALTVVLTAAYILWTLQRVFLGVNPAYKDFPDITVRELLCIIPLVVFAVLLGVFPQQMLLSWMEPSVTGLVNSLARLQGW